MSDNEGEKLRWYNLGLMGFVSVWGFGNVVNNYANQGLKVIVSWVLIIALYFIPYVLMVGELGSAFKDGKAGVSTWIRETTGASGRKLAYFAGFTYWVVHIPYLAQKPQSVLIALDWAIFPDSKFMDSFSTLVAQFLILGIFIFFMWVAAKGINSIKKIGTIAGTAVFVMSLLYILLVVTAPMLRGVEPATTNITFKSIMPEFNFAYFTTLSMLVFAVGGAEKLSPYVNNTKNSSKEFPRGMMILAGMVAICAILGSIAMSMMFDANNIPADLKMNGQYYAFAILGDYYGLGNTFVVLYSIANLLAQISALVFSIDAPLKVFLAEADEEYVPKSLLKTNENGTPITGYKITLILVGILIIVPALGIGDMNSLFNWLLDLNSIVMPMRYLWVFLAYVALRKAKEGTFNLEYKFVKNSKLAMVIGSWCFIFTAFACIMGMFPKGVEVFSSQWIFQITLNVLTPFILIALGFIFPTLAKKNKLK
ncbi:MULTISPECIES: amino acid permease [Clostridium]|uniref:Amino acid permease n=1 Tax=Clostridium senegalense TaxID=1465809 RepID=A0A6M0H5J1_9CLOT|nr:MULTISPECIES: amino acid permease [Clostridium]NEU05985.1 amino acid permease [Clostridium senegalense]